MSVSVKAGYRREREFYVVVVGQHLGGDVGLTERAAVGDADFVVPCESNGRLVLPQLVGRAAKSIYVNFRHRLGQPLVGVAGADDIVPADALGVVVQGEVALSVGAHRLRTLL